MSLASASRERESGLSQGEAPPLVAALERERLGFMKSGQGIGGVIDSTVYLSMYLSLLSSLSPPLMVLFP